MTETAVRPDAAHSSLHDQMKIGKTRGGVAGPTHSQTTRTWIQVGVLTRRRLDRLQLFLEHAAAVCRPADAACLYQPGAGHRARAGRRSFSAPQSRRGRANRIIRRMSIARRARLNVAQVRTLSHYDVISPVNGQLSPMATWWRLARSAGCSPPARSSPKFSWRRWLSGSRARGSRRRQARRSAVGGALAGVRRGVGADRRAASPPARGPGYRCRRSVRPGGSKRAERRPERGQAMVRACGSPRCWRWGHSVQPRQCPGRARSAARGGNGLPAGGRAQSRPRRRLVQPRGAAGKDGAGR